MEKWRRICESLWTSLYWDVYREGGGWRLAHLFEHNPLPRSFASAEEAMGFADGLEE